MDKDTLDNRIRLAAFEFLREQIEIHGEVLSASILSRGFTFEGIRVPFISPQGIFKPGVLPSIPLTIRTAAPVEGRERPYEDVMAEDFLLSYKYRGNFGDQGHRDNAGLREAMRLHKPLIYLQGIEKGQYLVFIPVHVVDDSPETLTFTVDLSEALRASREPVSTSDDLVGPARRYALVEARRRLHQEVFRFKVLRAYEERCAVCRLRHRELLEAAHILPDKHPLGEAVVPNGMALCRLHHAAYDNNILGIRPDRRIELRIDVLREIDGPMLEHGLKGFQGHEIDVPSARNLKPRREFLEERYELFRRAG